MYEEVLALKEEGNAQKRGYMFEQILREILPWSARPPIAISSGSEQLDAFFEWNSWHFLVEAKAKKGKITPGSHDWEDFELKVRKRKGACIGLFCSLYPISDKVFDAAETMNREGLCTLLLHGDIWERLKDANLEFEILLRYMVFRARSSFIPIPDQPKTIRSWHYDRDLVKKKIHKLCRRKSARFLRRFQHPRHSEVYVRRGLDSQLESAAKELMPSALLITKKESKKKGHSVTHDRSVPPQIFLLRDSSGSGKTTFSVSIGLTSTEYFGISRSAAEESIDDIDELLHSIGKKSGIQELISIDHPIVFAIDSLDEAGDLASKSKEVRSLMNLITELNRTARDYGLIAYPILLVFTVRDEYWREWETYFEGSNASVQRNRFSMFSSEEFHSALDKYRSVYNFSVAGKTTTESEHILKIPFNLQVFAEAHEYEIDISFEDVLEEKVLALYFERKGDNILGRRIIGFNQSIFMNVCAALAISCTESRQTTLHKNTIVKLINRNFPQLIGNIDRIIIALRSEQVIRQDSMNTSEFSFRHSRIVEYLTAHHIVSKVAMTGSTEPLNEIMEMVFQAGIVSQFRVHDFVRYIGNKEHPDLYPSIEKFYRASHRFMGALVSHQRSRIANGMSTNSSNLNLILKNAESSSPKIVWASFFVIAAAPNNQPRDKILSAFELAWTANTLNGERWKLISKLCQRGLYLDVNVFSFLLRDGTWKEWEVFLGQVLENNDRKEFKSLWESAKGHNSKKTPDEWAAPDWRVVRELLKILIHDLRHTPGSIN